MCLQVYELIYDLCATSAQIWCESITTRLYKWEHYLVCSNLLNVFCLIYVTLLDINFKETLVPLFLLYQYFWYWPHYIKVTGIIKILL